MAFKPDYWKNGESGGTPITATQLNRIEAAGDAKAQQGPKGDTGPQGDPGTDGVSVTGANINGSGELVLTLSDSSTINAGNVQGPKGEQGPKGDTGPQGPKGDTGEGVPTGGTSGQQLTKASGTDFDTKWGAA